MPIIDQKFISNLYLPPKDSHKGNNGKLTIIGGSDLFHGASLWALKIASRIVDMVFYAPVKENEVLTRELKSKLYDFICVPREQVGSYIKESDAVLIGPGMKRSEKLKVKSEKLSDEDWQENTYEITKYLIARFPVKKWIIDAGSLQMMEAKWLKQLNQALITPHLKEFVNLFQFDPAVIKQLAIEQLRDLVSQKAKEHNCVIVLKGKTDIVCSPNKCLINQTGNVGMTKGGTGDVLAGLIAALACKNDLFLAGCAGVYLNGLAGDELYKKVGPYFNASDLCDQIPVILKRVMSKQ